MHTEVLLSEMKYIRQKILLLRIMVVANIKKNNLQLIIFKNIVFII